MKYRVLFVSLGSSPLFSSSSLSSAGVAVLLLKVAALSAPRPASKRYSLAYGKYTTSLFSFHGLLQSCSFSQLPVSLPATYGSDYSMKRVAIGAFLLPHQEHTMDYYNSIILHHW